MWIISTGNALTKRLSGLLLGLISWCQTKEFRYIDYSAVCYLKTPFFMLSLAWKFFTSKTFETFSFERIHKCFSYSVGNQEFFFFFFIDWLQYLIIQLFFKLILKNPKLFQCSARWFFFYYNTWTQYKSIVCWVFQQTKPIPQILFYLLIHNIINH